MPQIPTNARTPIRAIAPDGTDLHPWTIEFIASDPDIVRLYSVDGDPSLILVETSDREGSFTLSCYLGQHGTERDPAGSLGIEVSQHAAAPEAEIEFDLRT